MSRLDDLYFKLPVWAQEFGISAFAWYRDKFFRGNKYYPEATELVKKINNASQEEIQTWQLEQLGFIVNYAIENTNFYKEYYNTDRVNLKSFEDFKKLPTINKQMVRENWGKFQVKINEKVFETKTSGTTGSSLHIRNSPKLTAVSRAGFHYDRGKIGFNSKERLASFTSRVIMPQSANSAPYWRYNAYSKQLLFSIWHVSDASLPSYIKKYNEFAPTFVNGFPSFLYLIAEFSLRNDLFLHKPQYIFTSSETLLPYQREIIESAFKTKILDTYGVSEELFTARQCIKGEYHLREELGYLEVIDGLVYGTTFHNTAMPLIRYEVGDLASLDMLSCDCGIIGRVIKEIEGRKDDIIVSKSGKKYGRISRIFMGINFIKEAQVVQKDIENLQINLVINRDDADLSLLENQIKNQLGAEFNITYCILDCIPRSKNGKYRFVISEINKKP